MSDDAARWTPDNMSSDVQLGRGRATRMTRVTRINAFDNEDWDEHVSSVGLYATAQFSTELSDEIDGFAQWYDMSREQLIYRALVEWMKAH
jgi:hypothetical protein